MPDISQINIPNNDGSMTYNLKDANVPHSSLPAVSGGTDLSLVTTGEKADWIDKTKIYQVKCTLGSSIGSWNCNLDLPVLYDGLLLLCKCPSDTYNNGGTISLYVTLSDGTVVNNIVIGGNLSDVILGEYYLFRYSVSDIVTTWDWVGALAYGSKYVSQQSRNTGLMSVSYPLLFSDTAADSTSGYRYTATAYTYRLYYDPYNANLVTPKINNYTLASACEKQVDAEVEQSSDNLPTSDAVYNAINNIHIQTKTVSGAIATFNDASGDVPFATLKIDINPVQDLHGYSKPWSGGCGKNLLNYDSWKTVTIARGTAVWENNGVKITATVDDAYTDFANNYFPVDARITVSEGETITLSWEETTNKSGLVVIFPNGTATGMVRANNQQVKKISYTATSGVTYVTFRFGVANSGDTIAYKNIQIEKGSQATSWEPYSNICPISGFSALNVTLADGDMQTVDTASVNFGQTVYGGVADVTNGKLTITHKYQDLGGIAWSKQTSVGGTKTYFRTSAEIADMKKNTSVASLQGLTCSDYPEDTWTHTVDTTGYDGTICTGWTNKSYVAIYDSSKTSLSADDFKTAMSGVQLVYELATPTEITTTPENLTALSGQNNVYSDTNGDTTVEYFSGDCDGIIKLLKALSVI